MGQTESTTHARRVDPRWARVALEQLRDDEFLSKQLRRQETIAGARRAAEANGGSRRQRPRADLFVDATKRGGRRGGSGRALWTALLKRKDEGDQSEDEAGDGLADGAGRQWTMEQRAKMDEKRDDELMTALVLLGEMPPARRAAFLLCHLQEQLARECFVADPVAEVVALRKQILRDVYDAVTLQHQHFRAAATAFQSVVRVVRNKKQFIGDAPSDASTIEVPAQRSENVESLEATFAVVLVVEMISNSLEMSTLETGQARRELFHEIAALVETLTPLSLIAKRKVDTSSNARLLSGDGSADTRGLVRQLQGFLLMVVAGGGGVVSLEKRDGGVSPRRHPLVATEFSVADRTRALNCLIHLAAAAGSVRDFLVVLSVLLGVRDAKDSSAKPLEAGGMSISGTSSTTTSKSSNAVVTLPALKSARMRNTIHLKEFETDDVLDDERGDLSDELANFAVEQRLKQVHKQRTDYIPKRDIDGQTTVVDQLLSANVKRKAAPKNLVVTHMKTILAQVSGSNAATVVHRASVPHHSSAQTFSLNGKHHSKASKDDLNNLALEAGVTYSLDAASARSEITPLGQSPRHEPLIAPCPRFLPLSVGAVLKEMDLIKPVAPNRQASMRTASSLGTEPTTGSLAQHHTEGSDDDREVWSCGQNSYGELGHGDTNTRKSFERVDALHQKDIIQVSAGNEHSIVLSADGVVWTCGYNDNGQCGQGVTTRINHLTEVQKLGDTPITQVHAYNGCEHTILVTQDGRAASCGYNYRGQLGHGNTQSEAVPKIMRGIEGKFVRLVSCSYYHTAITCDGGANGHSLVYTFGRNDYGQLGHADTIDRKVPQSVEALHDQHIISIACGQYHTMVATASGKLFAFGKNDYGQLGVETVENQLAPVLVKVGLERQTCLEVRCGYYHSIVLCAGAHLFGFGRNDYGQLGLGKASSSNVANIQLQQQRFAVPQLIEDLEGKEIVRFACGCYHTVAVSDNGVLYVFGRNNHGQLGTGDANERLYPFPMDDFVGKRVAMVAAGFYHTLVLTGGKEDDGDEEQEQAARSFEVDESMEIASHDKPFHNSTSFSSGAILSHPFVKEIFDAKTIQEPKSPAVPGNLQPHHSKPSDASRHQDEPLAGDPSFDGDVDDGRTEDRQRESQQHIYTDAEAGLSLIGTREFGQHDESDARDSITYRAPRVIGDSVDVAVIVFAQLDRLVAPCLQKRGPLYPPAAQLPASFVDRLLSAHGHVDVSDLLDECFDVYTIHVHSSTFSSLCRLIDHLSDQKVDAISSSSLVPSHVSSPGLPRKTSIGPTSALQEYLLKVCVRILHANLAQLTFSGVGNVVIALDHAGAESLQDSRSDIHGENELHNLRDSIHATRSTLLTLIEKGRLSSDAIDTLMLGFEVFFPCRCSRLAFLLIVVESTPLEDDLRCDVCRTIECLSCGVKNAKVRQHLLLPLLRRLTDDSILVKFLPLDSSVSQPEPFRVLDRVVDCLLDQLEKEFMRTIGEIAGIDSSRELRQADSSGYVGTEPKVGGSATNRAIVDAKIALLNAILKHLGAFATSCSDWKKAFHTAEGVGMAGRLSSVISQTFRIGHDSSDAEGFPIAWSGLLSFALRVIVHSSDFLLQLLSRNQVSPSCGENRADIFAESEFNEHLAGALEQSIVGRVLPPLVDGLLSFAHVPAFAVSLAQPLISVSTFLDQWNSTNEAVKRSSTTEIVDHLGKSIMPAAVPVGSSRQKSGGSTARRPSQGTASSRPDKATNATKLSVTDALASPWSLLLEKELVVVCAEMVATISLGDPLRELAPAAESTSHRANGPVLVKWRTAALFSGGISADFVFKSAVSNVGMDRAVPHAPSLPSACSITTVPRFQLILPSLQDGYDDEATPMADGGADTLRCVSETQAKLFLRCMAGFNTVGDSGRLKDAAHSLCQWIREAQAKHDPAYRMLVRQSQMQKQPQADLAYANHGTALPGWTEAQLEDTFFAALLHNLSLSLFAFSVGLRRRLPDHISNSPPRCLMSVWKVVADMRRRFVAKRTAIKNVSTSGEAQVAISDRQRSIIDRSHLLLLLNVEEDEEHRLNLLDSGFVAPWDPAYVFVASTKVGFSPLNASFRSHMSSGFGPDMLPFLFAFPLSRWRRVRTIFHVVVRWKAAVVSGKLFATNKRATEALDFVTTEDISGELIWFAHELLIEPCRRLSCSSRGFELLWQFIQVPRLEGVRVALLQRLSQVLELSASSKQSDGAYAQRSLISVPNTSLVYRERRRNAQNEVISVVAQLMLDKASEFVLNPLDAGQQRPSERVLLVILRCLSLFHFTPAQYQFINDLGIVQILHQIEQTYGGGGADREDSQLTGQSDSIRLMIKPTPSNADAKTCADCEVPELHLKRVVWTLIRCIAVHFSSLTSAAQGVLPLYPVCGDTFESLLAVGDLSLRLLARGAKRNPSQAEHLVHLGGSISATIRRSYEIIVSPRRFSFLRKGFLFGYDEMTQPASGFLAMSPLVKPNEFSITTWIYIASSSPPSVDPTSSSADLQSTGVVDERQVVFLRGSEREILPYLLLSRDLEAKWQVEVGVALQTAQPTTRLMWERLNSKNSIPSSRWTHLAVVMEGAKMRLYINGILDSQHSLSGPLAVAVSGASVDIDFCFGRQLPVAVALSSGEPGAETKRDQCAPRAMEFLSALLSASATSRSLLVASPSNTKLLVRSFDGLLSHFRFHNRSLSPIHVRIVYDEKKPIKEDEVSLRPPEAALPGMTTKILELHSLIRVMVESDEGRAHLAEPTWTAQLWEIFITSEHALMQVSSLRLLRLILRFLTPAAVAEATSHGDIPTHSFVWHLLHIIGVCLSPARPTSYEDSSLRLPATLTALHQSGDSFGVTSELRNSTAERMMQETTCGSTSVALASELTALLVDLAQQTGRSPWPQEIWAQVCCTLEQRQGEGQEFAYIGCLYALGGVAGVVGNGAEVEVAGTRERATIIASDEWLFTNQSSGRGRAAASRVNESADTVFVSIHDSVAPREDLREWHHLVCDECALYRQQVAASKMAAPKLFEKYSDSAPEASPFVRLHRDDIASVYGEPVLLRTAHGKEEIMATVTRWLSKAVRILDWDSSEAASLVPGGGGTPELHRWLEASLAARAVMQAASANVGGGHLRDTAEVVTELLRICSRDDQNPRFATLKDVERKLWVVRSRVCQVLRGLGDHAEPEVAHWLRTYRRVQSIGGTTLDQTQAANEVESPDVECSPIEGPASATNGTTNLRLELALEEPLMETRRLSPQENRNTGSDDGEPFPDKFDRDADEEGTGSNVGGENDGNDEEEEEEDGDEEDEEDEDDDDEEAEEHREEFVDELMMMGFPEEWCVLALKQTENDIVSASAWIVDNIEYLSRLQTTLDKQRDQSTGQLVFEDEDDDEGEPDLAEDETVPSDNSIEAGSPMHTHIGRQASGTRTNPHSPTRPDGSSHLHFVNDKEMGRKIFGEMYFPFEDGGFGANAKDQFFSSYRADTNATASASNATGSPSENPEDGLESLPSIDKAHETVEQFAIRVNSLELGGLLEHLIELERSFLVLSARQILTTLLGWRQLRAQADEVATHVVKSPLFATFLKLTLFRGDQFQVCGDREGDEPQQGEAALRAEVCRILNHTESETAAALLDFALDQIDFASSNAGCEAILWTQRGLQRPDRDAIEEPAVELAAWLFESVLRLEPHALRLSMESASMILERLRSALRSTNLPIKFLAITTISRVLQHLQRSPQLQSADSLSQILGPCRHDFESFLHAAKHRFIREQVQHRAIFSLYLQGYVEILFLLGRCAVGDSSNIPASTLGAPIATSCLFTDTTPQPTVGGGVGPAARPVLAFDRKKCRSNLLQISDDGLTVSYSGNEMWKTVVAAQGFATGVHEWHMRIEKSSSSYLFIGVATRKSNLDSFLGADDKSWGFIGDKALYYQRNRLRVYGDSFSEGDIVGVHLDCELGTLAFSKNGTFFGVAFENLLDEVFPAVAFYSRHQKVSLVVPESESAAEVGHTAASSAGCVTSIEGTVEEAVVVCEMMDCLASRSPLRSDLLRSAYHMTMSWWNGTGRHIVTRTGSTLWVTVTKDACSAFGFQANDRVRSPRGIGRVLGVADGRLWIEVDGEHGAWHIHPSRLRSMTLTVADTSAARQLKPDVEASVQQRETMSPVKRSGTAASMETAGMASQREGDSLTESVFSTFVQDRLWSLLLDRFVLNVVNTHCESASISPWNVPASEIIRIVRAKAHEIEQASGTPFSFDDSSSGGRRLEHKLVSRFGFLRFFNAYFSRVVGFFDPTWQYFAPQTGLLPCRLLSTCRGSIFTSTKNEFFTALMEKTANSPKKSDDDYDYPDDLTQMMINRPKAATAKCHPGTTKSLLLSMFGQAFDELHFLPLRMLRMVYSHPMDDGQLRSFKVKFEGEGVDDYGGPYREFFSQFFAELQMLCSEEEASESETNAANGKFAGEAGDKDGKLGVSFLPFLMPSPNWRNGVGSSREKFVLNGGLLGSKRVGSALVVQPSSTTKTEPSMSRSGWSENTEVRRQLLSEMCHFLGQMIGICLRTRVCVRLDLAMSVWKQLVAEDDLLQDDADTKESVLASLKETDFVAYTLFKTLYGLHEAYVHATGEARRADIEEELAAMDLCFTTYLSDGRLAELCENGDDTVVTMANLEKYLDLVLKARMGESRDVVNVIKQGIHSIIPVAALSMLTWEELEKRVCGVAEVDVELLKQNTEYDEDLSAQDEFIQRFWRVLGAMDDEDKRAFLRFVWARSRLPVGTAQFHQKFKIQSLASSTSESNSGSSSTSSSSTTGYADGQLPKSHTCFFALQLPRYSSDEICRKQLTYAIHNCVEMDGDFRLADTEMTGWTEIDPHDQLRF